MATVFSVHLLFSVVLSLAGSTSIQAALPRFSWDTLPVFFHSSNGSGLYTPDAIRAISRYSMVTVAQGQGHLVKTVDDEDAMVIFLRAVKKANPNTATYYYFNSFRDELDLSRTARQFEAHPNWALRDKDGTPVKGTQNRYVFDLSQLEVRQWLLNICLNGTNSAGGDGCYCDSSQWVDERFHPPVSPEKEKAWGEGLLNLTREVQDALGNDRLLIGKEPDQPYVKAAQFEFFRPNNESINNITEGVRNGKVMQAHMALGTPCEGDITDFLAAFLIAMGNYTYYGCGNWSTVGNDSSSFFWRPEYDKPLGAPLAPALYTDGVWRRQFSSGTRVTFDTSTNKGTIEWGKNKYLDTGTKN